MAATSSVAKSAQNASEIGWAFVPQYYTFVNKDPSRLHCFYTKRSTLIHSTEGEEATPCFGQQEIHEKFMSLNFDDCKVFVSNVDSQSSADGGIIVQVLGEMSNGAGPWRKFAQTFFLAEQPNGFFVLNDIFRYIKEEAEDGDEEPEAEPVTVTEDVASSETSLIAAEAGPPSYQPTPAESLPVTATVSQSTTLAPAVRSPSPLPAEPTTRPSALSGEQVSPTQTFGSSQVNGFHPDPVDVKPPEAPTEPAKPASKPQELVAPSSENPAPAVATASSPIPPSNAPLAPSTAPQVSVEPAKKPEVSATSVAPTQSSTPSQAPSTNGRSASGLSKAAPPSAPAPNQARPAEPAPLQPAAPPVPKTWASLAASGKSAWGQGHLAASQGVSTAPSAVSQSTVDTPSQTSQQRPAIASHPNPVDNVLSGACFIKSVHENLDEKSLREQLAKKFGPIKDLDVIRNKACGFLEFERVDSAKKAIQMSLPFNQGGKGGITISVAGGEEFTIHIESKRQPGERGRPIDAGPKRGFADRGGRPGGSYGPSSGRGRGGMEGPRGSGRGGPRGGGGGSRGMPHPK
ncbi:hypothetical protein CROQUDRAFT_657360 [Cronartium quercuum f. sp. fusiforme G11]|uniref:G3BP-like protein n=1 Tax=Cronartium quercuum f. sp. fusiforme G11 TaxID=708437 RepID=A0A9P6NLJ8_9BASI|nr:hypothetical protein CROQUDRAFT_657360 [Cronartium quercuum f. sp. fusiforme G11]